MPRPGPSAHPTMQTLQDQRLQGQMAPEQRLQRLARTFTVSVPAGLVPGQQFQAYLGGELADIIVPHGAAPSSTLHVQIPAAPPSSVRTYARS